MKKKIIAVLVLLILTSGCSVNYELEIGKVTKEKLYIKINEDNQDEKNGLSMYKDDRKMLNFLSNNVEYYYDMANTDYSSTLYFEYGEIVGLNLSNIVKSCYNTRSIVKDDNYYLINLNDFLCDSYNYVYADDINITITGGDNYNIIESNSLDYTNKKAIYNINNINNIYLKIEEVDTKEETENANNEETKVVKKTKEEKEKDHNDTMIYLGIGVISFILVLSLVLIISKKKN